MCTLSVHMCHAVRRIKKWLDALFYGRHEKPIQKVDFSISAGFSLSIVQIFWNLSETLCTQWLHKGVKGTKSWNFKIKEKNQSQNPHTKQVSTKVNSRVSKILYEKSKVLILSFHFKFQYLIPFIPLCTHWVHKVSESLQKFWPTPEQKPPEI